MNDTATARVLENFVDAWGAMGSLWGVNASVARVHGLLMATEQPWCLDDIAERLALSKSHVSGCLKELRSWAVVRKVVVRGDRREFYTCEPDVWRMLFNIIRERRKRDFEPTLATIRQTVSAAAAGSGLHVERLRQLEDMLLTFDRLAARFLSGESQARAIIAFLTSRD